jgi:hypothetical protein
MVHFLFMALNTWEWDLFSKKGTCKKLPSVGIYNVHYEILILDF